MVKVKFIKDHPSKKFKENQIIELEDSSVDIWIKSGYVKLANSVEENVGNVLTSSEKDGEKSKGNSKPQSNFGNKKNKKNKKKNRK